MAVRRRSERVKATTDFCHSKGLDKFDGATNGMLTGIARSAAMCIAYVCQMP